MPIPDASSNRPVILHLLIRARAGARQELLTCLREATPFYEAPGGIRVRLLQRLDDSDSFVEIIEYSGAAEYERDSLRVASDAEMKNYLNRWRALLGSNAEVIVYQDVTSEIRGGDQHAG